MVSLLLTSPLWKHLVMSGDIFDCHVCYWHLVGRPHMCYTHNAKAAHNKKKSSGLKYQWCQGWETLTKVKAMLLLPVTKANWRVLYNLSFCMNGSSNKITLCDLCLYTNVVEKQFVIYLTFMSSVLEKNNSAGKW